MTFSEEKFKALLHRLMDEGLSCEEISRAFNRRFSINIRFLDEAVEIEERDLKIIRERYPEINRHFVSFQNLSLTHEAYCKYEKKVLKQSRRERTPNRALVVIRDFISEWKPDSLEDFIMKSFLVCLILSFLSIFAWVGHAVATDQKFPPERVYIQNWQDYENASHRDRMQWVRQQNEKRRKSGYPSASEYELKKALDNVVSD